MIYGCTAPAADMSGDGLVHHCTLSAICCITLLCCSGLYPTVVVGAQSDESGWAGLAGQLAVPLGDRVGLLDAIHLIREVAKEASDN